MTTDEAILQLTNLKEYLAQNIPLSTADESINMAIQALRTQQNGGWISVEDRLPKGVGNRVLVLFKYGHVTLAHFEKPNMPEQWYDFEANRWRLTSDISHWQPLPEPPKGE